MVIGKELIEELHLKAVKSDRLRVNYDLRDSDEDVVLRLLTVMEPGTVVPIHRHPACSELLVVIHGRLEELYYDDNGRIVKRIELGANGDSSSMIIPSNQWHSIIVKEPCTAIVECREGPLRPTEEKDILKI